VFAHVPLQFVSPPVHCRAQLYVPELEAMQSGAVELHVVPHPPQFVGAVMSVSQPVDGLAPQCA